MATQFDSFTIDETVSDSAETMVDSSTSQRKVFTAATFYNAHTSSVSITVYRFASGGSAGTTNIIAKRTLPAGASWICRELINQAIKDGELVQAVAGTADVVNAHISGIIEY